MSSFKIATQDYRYLLNKDYPQKALLKLIGDRYRLSKLERNCLFRGIVKNRKSESRQRKIISGKKVKNKSLGIDWYNILITVESYFKGYPIFISDDNIVRDSSAIHGSYRISKVTDRVISEILNVLHLLNPANIEVFLDSPISHSGKMAELLRQNMEKCFSFPFNIEVVPSADYPLKNYKGIVSSSDSIILEQAEKVFDLSRFVLKKCFNFNPPKIESVTIIQ